MNNLASFILKMFLLTYLLVCFTDSYSQRMFDKKLDNCSPNFKLERSEIIMHYKRGDSLLVQDIMQGADPKHVQRLKGVLAVQIIIDSAGNSCLSSYDHKYNMLRKPFDIEENINQLGQWSGHPQNPYTGVLFKIFFEKRQIRLQRLGFDRNSGWKLLSKDTFNKPEPEE